jgi:Phage integrase, N-terminal SAM-like domain
MRVISAQVLCTDATLLDAFRHHLVARDLAPTTVRAYLSDLERFRTWLAWVHEGTSPAAHPGPDCRPGGLSYVFDP